MKYLMVSSYLPMNCGIAKYAFQMAKKLREEGHIVNILSPLEGNGDFITNIKGGFNLLKILKYGVFYDKIIFQYHESFFYKEKLRHKIPTHISFLVLFLLLRKKIEIIIHEITYRLPKIDKFFEKTKWRFCPKLIFHTKRELQRFEEYYFKLSVNRFKLYEHKYHFYKFTNLSKEKAREKLGIKDGLVVFLCIGFIQPHKGFDRAIKAFKEIENEHMLLYVVGSLRLEYYRDYVEKLKKMAEGSKNIKIIEKYLTDEEFDMWIVASDCIIVPYKNIWSSGVIGRAKLYNKPVIASNVGGIVEQLDRNDIVFQNNEELKFILKEFSKEMKEREEGSGTVPGCV